MSDSFLTRSNPLEAIQSLDNWIEDIGGLPQSNRRLRGIVLRSLRLQSILNRPKESKKIGRRRTSPPKFTREQQERSPLFFFDIPQEEEKKASFIPDFLEPSIGLLRRISFAVQPFDQVGAALRIGKDESLYLPFPAFEDHLGKFPILVPSNTFN